MDYTIITRRGFRRRIVRPPARRWYVKSLRRAEDVLYQPVGHVLLLVQRAEWIQSFPGAGDLRESMKEADMEMILERAQEKYPEAKPRIISDNGPQFIARDFKEFIRISGMTHVR